MVTEEEVTRKVLTKVLEVLSRHEREDDMTKIAPSCRREIENIKYHHGCVD